VAYFFAQLYSRIPYWLRSPILAGFCATFAKKRFLLSFPGHRFRCCGQLPGATDAERLDCLTAYGPRALFAAGALGQFFSLTPQEFVDIIRTAVDTCRAKIPIIAGAGGATRMAITHAQEAQRLGAQGVLLLPHYLIEASQQGLAALLLRLSLLVGCC
jgi:5-dehydro-4-deoxyglucarate dehydratase